MNTSGYPSPRKPGYFDGSSSICASVIVYRLAQFELNFGYIYKPRYNKYAL